MLSSVGDIDIDLTMVATGGLLVDSIITNAYVKTQDGVLTATCNSVNQVR